MDQPVQGAVPGIGYRRYRPDEIRADRWVHARPSGTEPIVRFIAEAPTAPEAEELVSACRAAFGKQ